METVVLGFTVIVGLGGGVGVVVGGAGLVGVVGGGWGRGWAVTVLLGSPVGLSVDG
jgi:hypothetical protein